MRTNIFIDDDLMAEAMQAAGKTTKRETVEEGLRRMVAIWRQRRLLELRGIGWEGDLDDMRTSKYANETW